MANSYEIIQYKQKAMSLIVNNEAIIDLIDEKDAEYPDDLINTNLFSYLRVPTTEQEAKTYILLTVDVPTNRSQNNLLKNVVFTVFVVSHQEKMYVPRRAGNRVDLLAHEIDKLFNGSDVFGIGELKLVSNTEGFVGQNYPSRTIKFTVEDFDNKRCLR